MRGALSTCFDTSLLERKTSTTLGGTAMSNTDEERHEPTGTYANRGIQYPIRWRKGYRNSDQKPGPY